MPLSPSPAHRAWRPLLNALFSAHRPGSRRPIRRRALAGPEPLEDRTAPAAAFLDNVDGNLAALYSLSRPDTIPTKPQGAAASIESLNGLFLHNGSGQPLVDIWTRTSTDATVQSL